MIAREYNTELCTENLLEKFRYVFGGMYTNDT